MTLNFIKAALLLTCVLALSACSASGDWPDLSQPAEGFASASEPPIRVIAVPAPLSGPEMPVPILDNVPESDSDKRALIDATVRNFQTMTATFQGELDAFTGIEAKEQPYAWNGLQISLTRLSNVTNQLNGLIAMKYGPAITADDDMFAAIVALRTSLNAVRPN